MTSFKLMMLGSVATVALGAAGVTAWTVGRGPSAASLATDLRGPDAHARHDAARKLAKLGPAAKDAVAALAAALADPDKRVRFHSAKALAEVGPDAKPATDQLIAALAEVDADTRYYVVKALDKVHLDAAHAAVAPTLVRALTDNNARTRYYAVKCLKELGPAAAPAAGPLRTLTNDPDKDVREAAAAALKRVTKKN
jgi:HEAT repeat protein